MENIFSLSATLKNIRRFGRFCRIVAIRFRQDGCSHRAAALAFTTLLSLVPLMTVSFTVLAAFPVFKQLVQKLQGVVIQNFVATSAQVVQHHLEAIVRQTSKLSAVGLIFLSITAVLMVFNMEQAFNAIWQVKRQRIFISAFLMYWAVLTLTPVLMGLALALSTYLISLPFFSSVAITLSIKKLLLIIMPYLSILIAFTILYLAVPNCKVHFRHALVGGIVASILFEIVKFGFILYITHFSIYRLLYGALAALPIFLVWIYLCWLIILFGAVISATLEQGIGKLPN